MILLAECPYACGADIEVQLVADGDNVRAVDLVLLLDDHATYHCPKRLPGQPEHQ